MIDSHPYRTLLRKYLAPMWVKVLLLFVLLLGGAGLTLLSPRILAAFIDAVFVNGSQNIFVLAGLFLGIALINQAISIVTSYLGSDIGLRATNQLRADLTLHCLQLDMSFHHGMTPGVLVERIDGDISRLHQFLSSFAVMLFRNALLIAGSVVAIFLIEWRAGLALAVAIVVTLGALELSRRWAVPAIARERETSAQLFGIVEEHLSSTEDLRANGSMHYAMRHFFDRSRDWSGAFTRAHALSYLPWPISRIMFVLNMVLALGMATWLVGSGAITIGLGYAIFRYVEMIRWPVLYLGRQVQDLQYAGAAIIRIRELLLQKSTIQDTGQVVLPQGALRVAFDDVTFSYLSRRQQSMPADDPSDVEREESEPHYALRNLSFSLPAGQVLGLLGRTGSGKSTISRLLFRLYESDSGIVRLNDTALPDIKLDTLHDAIGLVTQDVHLFNASVRDNVTLFDPSISDDRVVAAIEAVELGSWFQTLPNGLDTIVSAGNSMSAGQAQLLALSRLWLRDPGLLVLDEASSRLDPATESQLDRALDRLLMGRTAIIIAHRLTTIQRADWIMILDAGQCVEFGPRAELANNPQSHFSQLQQVGLKEALA
ncbi:MAG: ABC transporter ATP-binding protein [Chloroflexota bacterium]